LIICHSRKFIFIHIHKTGGTSVEMALEPILTWRDLILGSSAFGELIQPEFNRRFSLEKHSSISEVERVCGSEMLSEYYVFATVRHPLDRICSVYNFIATVIYSWARNDSVKVRMAERLFKRRSRSVARPRQVAMALAKHHADTSARALADEARQKAPELAWPASIAFFSTDSFSAFIRHSRLFEDRAFQTQVSQLCNNDGTSVLTSAFRIEDQSRWIPIVSERIAFKISLPRLNVSQLKLITPETVSVDDRAYIEKRFREDYRRFGY
jgi:hypothetical protein